MLGDTGVDSILGSISVIIAGVILFFQNRKSASQLTKGNDPDTVKGQLNRIEHSIEIMRYESDSLDDRITRLEDNDNHRRRRWFR